MSVRIHVLLGLLAMLPLGCSEQGAIQAGPNDRVGPHRGVLVALPNDQGYAEIFNSPQRRGRGTGRAPTQVVVCFLNNDLTSPAAATPSGVSVKLTVTTDTPVTVSLDAAPEAGDPLGKNRFISKSGPYELSDAHGELTGTLGGQPFSGEFDGGAR